MTDFESKDTFTNAKIKGLKRKKQPNEEIKEYIPFISGNYESRLRGILEKGLVVKERIRRVEKLKNEIPILDKDAYRYKDLCLSGQYGRLAMTEWNEETDEYGKVMEKEIILLVKYIKRKYGNIDKNE